jgi:hypothetical protein
MSCPFYGFHRAAGLQLLIDQLGNECPLRPAYAPCTMEIAGLQPHLATCPVARDQPEDVAEIRENYIVVKLRADVGRFTFREWEDICATR